MAAYIGISFIYPLVIGVLSEKSPVVGIEAANRKEYAVNEELKKRDFEVSAIHENGMETRLSGNEFDLSGKKLKPYGRGTKITVTLKGDKGMSCTVLVKNRREKLEAFDCGSPAVGDVSAVLYSNGELSFEGAGEVLQFNEGSFPWQESDHANEIRYVTFGEGVRPTSLDYFFAGLENLSYVSPIPASVTSMSGTFADCAALKEAPDWSACDGLLDLSGCYEDCSSLVSVPAVPTSVRTLTSAFAGCSSLQAAPDLSGAESVLAAGFAFKDCGQLVTVTLPPGVADISGMFEGCINLKDMPEIPTSVTNMNGAFNGALSLSTLTVIPEHVQDAGACFGGCGKISGVLWVDGNPQEFGGCFQDAAVATTVDLQGNSSLMDALANTGTNITVNGNMPDPEIQDYDDVFPDG
ncbi:hypothetical protein C818_02704 [Lachnospiraceae bacterium MD308]|nr:hypothetical protein C818_02704 [Lachnospiraceae bacterium MD308]